MSDALGYVVIEWNQASHQPDVVDGSFTDDRDVAVSTAEYHRDKTALTGRRETYTIAAVVENED